MTVCALWEICPFHLSWQIFVNRILGSVLFGFCRLCTDILISFLIIGKLCLLSFFSFVHLARGLSIFWFFREPAFVSLIFSINFLCLILSVYTFTFIIFFLMLVSGLFCSPFSRFVRWEQDLRFSSFTMCVFSIINFLSSINLAMSQKRDIFLFSFHFVFFKIFLETPPLAQWLHRNALFSFQVFGDSPFYIYHIGF